MKRRLAERKSPNTVRAANSSRDPIKLEQTLPRIWLHLPQNLSFGSSSSAVARRRGGEQHEFSLCSCPVLRRQSTTLAIIIQVRQAGTTQDWNKGTRFKPAIRHAWLFELAVCDGTQWPFGFVFLVAPFASIVERLTHFRARKPTPISASIWLRPVGVESDEAEVSHVTFDLRLWLESFFKRGSLSQTKSSRFNRRSSGISSAGIQHFPRSPPPRAHDDP